MTLIISGQIALNERTGESTEKNLEGSNHGLVKIPSWHLAGEIEENLSELWTAGVSAKIWTEHLLQTSVEYYFYTNLLCFNM
jgi:hypothetical protein